VAKNPCVLCGRHAPTGLPLCPTCNRSPAGKQWWVDVVEDNQGGGECCALCDLAGIRVEDDGSITQLRP
jgi:hypothetical protein